MQEDKTPKNTSLGTNLGNSGNNIIDTFKKHIKEQGIEPDMLAQNALSNIQAIKSNAKLPFLAERKIRNFGEDIKSANELTGALQTLQIAFKKLLLFTDEISQDSSNQARGQVYEQIKDRISSTTFMGDGLFDTVLSVKIGGKEILLENPSPMPLLESSKASGESEYVDFENFKDYVSEKLLEINETLSLLSEAISQAQIFDKAQEFDSFDSSAFERFDKNMFKNLK